MIGVDEYDGGIPALRSAVSDAKGVGDILERDHGYEVRSLYDRSATAAAIRDVLAALQREARPDDRFLLYFAGHGIALQNDDGPAGYLIPTDARLGQSESYVPMTELHVALEHRPV